MSYQLPAPFKGLAERSTNELISGGLLVLCVLVVASVLLGVFEPNSELIALVRMLSYVLVALVMIFLSPLTGVFTLAVFGLAFSSPAGTGETVFGIIVLCLVWTLIFVDWEDTNRSDE